MGAFQRELNKACDRMANITVWIVIESLLEGDKLARIGRFHDLGPLCVITERGKSCFLRDWKADPRTAKYTLPAA